MAGIFLDASMLQNQNLEEAKKLDIQQNKIRFEFPNGFSELRLIEEWQKVHPEFYCDIFAIGKDSKGRLILNLYFRFIEDEFD